MGFFGACLLPALLFLCPTPAAAQVKTVDYIVKDGDTCESIADDFYEHAGGCDLIKKYNGDDAESLDLTPGNVISLPTEVSKAEALVDLMNGPVRAREPDHTWREAHVGQELYRTWRVNTLEQARAELAFRDQSRLKMREQTLVIIFGASRQKAQRRRTRARLQKGTLRSRLGELAGQNDDAASQRAGMDLETPTAKARLTRGESLVDVQEEDGTTRVANHGGAPIEVDGRGNASGNAVTVDAGMGTKVERNKPPTPPKKLPPAPTWKQAPADVLSIGGQNVTLSAEWKPVPKAAEYFVELTADKNGIEVIKSAYVPADVTSLEVQNVPPGTYWATVSTIDADKFEGIPSKRLKMQVVAVEHAEDARLGGEETPTFALGTRLTVRGGHRCRLGGAEPARTLRLTTPGRFELHCETENGRSTRPRPLAVAAPQVEIGGSDVRDGTVEVNRRGVARFELNFQPLAPADLQVGYAPNPERNGKDEPDASSVETTATRVTRTSWRVRLTTESDKTAREGVLTVRAGRNESGEPVELTTIPVRIAAAAAADDRGPDTEAADRPERAFRVGLLGGVRRRYANATDIAPWLGLEPGLLASFSPNPRFTAEIAAAAHLAGAVPMLDTRARTLLRFPFGDFAPYLGANFGTAADFQGNVDPFVGAFGGAAIDLGGRWRLRLDGGVDLAVGPAGGAVVLPGGHFSLLYRVR